MIPNLLSMEKLLLISHDTFSRKWSIYLIRNNLFGTHSFLSPKIKGGVFLFLKFGQRGGYEKIFQK